VTGLRAERLLDGRVLELRLCAPPKNLLDRACLVAITEELGALRLDEDPDRHLCAILLSAEGNNFSVGASVAEHTPAEAPAMLQAFYGAVRALLDPSLPIVAAVQGHCLGAGLELASLALRVVMQARARLGQPEIKLAALAPIASVVLPRRIGQARAEELLLSGRTVDAAEALRIGLCDEVTIGDPREVALSWLAEHLCGLSASALRQACKAARRVLEEDLEVVLPQVDDCYQDLLRTHDCAEGVAAFLEKRSPAWSDA